MDTLITILFICSLISISNYMGLDPIPRPKNIKKYVRELSSIKIFLILSYIFIVAIGYLNMLFFLGYVIYIFITINK